MRRVLKVSLAGFTIIAILLALAGLLSRDTTPAPSFRFLGDQRPISCDKPESRRSPDRTTVLVYVFEADFNDVCREADAELASLGFLDFQPPPPQDEGNRRYCLWNTAREERVVVDILDERRSRGLLESSGHFTAEQLAQQYKNGWVYVSVVQMRPKLGLGNRLRSRARKSSRPSRPILRRAPSARDLKEALGLSYDVYPSVGMHPVRFGMLGEEVIQVIGEPENIENKDRHLLYETLGFSIMLSAQGRVQNFNFYTRKAMPGYGQVRDFTGQTKQGISMGASRSEIVGAYGEPTSEHQTGFRKWMVYNREGLAFVLLNDELIQFMLFAPRPDEAIPFISSTSAFEDPRLHVLRFYDDQE